MCIGDHKEHHRDRLPARPLHHSLQLRLHHTNIRKLLGDGRQRIFHGPVRLALNEDVSPLMENTVWNLHFERIDGTRSICVNQLCLIDKCLKIGLHRLIDVGQVFLDCPDQVLCAQVGSGDDGDGRFQFFVQMLFITGCGAAQIPNRSE